MTEKVLITGSNGLLGQKLVNFFKENYEVYALSRGENRNSITNGYTYYNIDVTDFNKLHFLVNEIQPHFIINAAAMTNVDECEVKQKECNIINVELVRQLVQSCKNNNIHLIHISTDFIFDGKDGPYKETDTPNPLSHYGLTKLKSEEIIIHAKIEYTIIRTILVYGIVDNMFRNNIILWIKDSIDNKKIITIIDDQFRMPTFVDDLAMACLAVVQKKAQGIFNVSSNKLISIYDMAIEIANAFNLDKSYIKRITTGELNQKAKRPAITGFNLEKANKILDLPLVSFTERLQVFKNQLEAFNK
jgi:dTDP-4-dehydrorhamnose reductase